MGGVTADDVAPVGVPVNAEKGEKSESVGTVILAGSANLAIAIAKLAAGLFSGSAAMLSERSEEHTSEFQSLSSISYAVFCLKKKRTRLNSSHSLPSRMPSSA